MVYHANKTPLPLLRHQAGNLYLTFFDNSVTLIMDEYQLQINPYLL